jgi:F0F1-type ATP synthase membrane subunit a
MPFTPRKPQNESEAVEKLVKDINQIDEDKNKVGRIVLAVFAFVFLAASILLGVLITAD